MDSVKISTAFIPVADPASAAGWYGELLGFRIESVNDWSAVLRPDLTGATALTLLGPASGIQATPGLNWATCSFAVADLDGMRADLQAKGLAPTPIEGDPKTVRFFTIQDPDNNTLLLTDR